VVGAPVDGFRTRFPPTPGSIAALLENAQLAGAIPPMMLESWPAPTLFAGRKNLMYQLSCTPVESGQTDDYCLWSTTPGDDLFDFLARLANTLGAVP
jgi:hypothetical protein